MKRKIFIIALTLSVILSGIYFLRDKWFPLFFLPQISSEFEKGMSVGDGVEVTTVAGGLEIPWEVVFLPDGSMLVTERPGRLVWIDREAVSIPIDGVRHIGEGGLLGMVLHPDFNDNGWVYLYMTFDGEEGLENKVERYLFQNGTISERTTIIDGIPGSRFHNGGRIKFGPDGYLYITTGDAQEPNLAQDISSLAGKILRICDDGSVPEGNPFGNEVYSLGHRNPQGIVWDEEGRLWATEHGPTARDEVNIIESASNYGWPIITGDERREEMESPFVNSGIGHTWAPSGMAHLSGKILFVGLRSQALYELDPEKGIIKEHFKGDFGRMRFVRSDSDGSIHIGTSNRDGRGFPGLDDDRIIKFDGGLLGL